MAKRPATLRAAPRRNNEHNNSPNLSQAAPLPLGDAARAQDYQQHNQQHADPQNQAPQTQDPALLAFDPKPKKKGFWAGLFGLSKGRSKEAKPKQEAAVEAHSFDAPPPIESLVQDYAGSPAQDGYEQMPEGYSNYPEAQYDADPDQDTSAYWQDYDPHSELPPEPAEDSYQQPEPALAPRASRQRHDSLGSDRQS